MEWGLWSSAEKRLEYLRGHWAVAEHDGVPEAEAGGASRVPLREPGVVAQLGSSLCKTWSLFLRSLMVLCSCISFVHFLLVSPWRLITIFAASPGLLGASLHLSPVAQGAGPVSLAPTCSFMENQSVAFYIIITWLRAKEHVKKPLKLFFNLYLPCGYMAIFC